MRWVGRLMTSAAALLLATGGVSATTQASGAPEDIAWATAVKSNSLEAYAEFVMQYPESRHTPVAYNRLFGVETISSEANSSGVAMDDETESDPGLLPGIFRMI